MKLLKLSYRAADRDWGFKNLTFEPDITLIVGASGVGKTRILDAIFQLHRIATGTTGRTSHFWGIDWACEFSIDGDTLCIWNGRFESLESRRSSEALPLSMLNDPDIITELGLPMDQIRPRVLQEALQVNDVEIFRRDKSGLVVDNKAVSVKVSSFDSCLAILREEPKIRSVFDAMSRIFQADTYDDFPIHRSNFNVLPEGHYKDAIQRYSTLDAVRQCRLPTFYKLLLAHKVSEETFDNIVLDFKDIFPSIESVDVRRPERLAQSELPIVYFRESEVNKDFPFSSLSAGMQSTFLHLARLVLSADGSVVLIDEFETGLGTNCINVVAKRLLSDNARLQFIATSHHPYIINTIPMDRLRVIGRAGGEVMAYTVGELKLGRSKHTSFTQLINTELFKTGTIPDELVSAG